MEPWSTAILPLGARSPRSFKGPHNCGKWFLHTCPFLYYLLFRHSIYLVCVFDICKKGDYTLTKENIKTKNEDVIMWCVTLSALGLIEWLRWKTIQRPFKMSLKLLDPCLPGWLAPSWLYITNVSHKAPLVVSVTLRQK